MLSVSSLAAFAGPLLSVGDNSHWAVSPTSFLVSELQSTLVSFVHTPESTWTDQEGSSSGTDVTWCGTSVTPECDIVLECRKGDLFSRVLLILQGKWDSVHYCNSSTARVKLHQDKFNYLMSLIMFLLPL